MSPSADPRRTGVRLVAVAAAVATASGLPHTLLADAAPASNPRVYPLIAHVFHLRANTTDLGGAASVSGNDQAIDATLNSSVLFAKDSAVIRPQARARLAQIAAQLRAAGPGSLQVVGYTDDLGSAQHGLVLSRQRAQAVRTALGALAGVTVTVKGLGEADPVAPNTSEANRAKNRRVELHYRHR